MVLVNALFFALYLIMVKPLLIRFDTLQLMRWLFFYGSILVAPLGGRNYPQSNGIISISPTG